MHPLRLALLLLAGTGAVGWWLFLQSTARVPANFSDAAPTLEAPSREDPPATGTQTQGRSPQGPQSGPDSPSESRIEAGAPPVQAQATSDGIRSWLETCLVDLNGVMPQAREPLVERALATSLAAILDSQDRSVAIESIQGGVLARVPRGEQAFQMNSRYYRFSTGEFPEYDLLIDFKRRHAAWAAARPQDADASAWEAREPVFPEELVELSRQRVEEALARLR